MFKGADCSAFFLQFFILIANDGLTHGGDRRFVERSFEPGEYLLLGDDYLSPGLQTSQASGMPTVRVRQSSSVSPCSLLFYGAD